VTACDAVVPPALEAADIGLNRAAPTPPARHEERIEATRGLLMGAREKVSVPLGHVDD